MGNDNQTFNVYTDSTLSMYRKGLCGFFPRTEIPLGRFLVCNKVKQVLWHFSLHTYTYARMHAQTCALLVYVINLRALVCMMDMRGRSFSVRIYCI